MNKDERNFEVFHQPGGTPVKAWVRNVPFEDEARQQLLKVAKMPFIYRHVCAMPDVHSGSGTTIGSVIPTLGAIIPAAVGVDIGCGMMAVQTSLMASQLPDNLGAVRAAIEQAVPHGRTDNGGPNDQGAWSDLPPEVEQAWKPLAIRYQALVEKHPWTSTSNSARHVGTLGTGNHFIEVCLDESDRVWVMLHSGSRGVGGRIGSYFIELAKREMERWFIPLPDNNLAYLPEGSPLFANYFEAVQWAQDFALENRQVIITATVRAMRAVLPEFSLGDVAINCHHNYVACERHFGKDIFVTRKGAVRARQGDLGIIPGSMGAKSFIVRGKGNRDSFESCSHGAGRTMSRTEAKRRFTVADHIEATKGIECRKDAEVIDETPMAYKDIDAVMVAQKDLIDIVHTLRQVVCVKG